MTTKELNRCQAHWAEFLAQFQFEIIYQPRKDGVKPNSLTRHSDNRLRGQDDERVRHQLQILLKPANLGVDILRLEDVSKTIKLAKLIINNSDIDIIERIKMAYKTDPLISTILDHISRGMKQLPKGNKTSLANYRVLGDGLLQYKDRIWVLADDELCRIIL